MGYWPARLLALSLALAAAAAVGLAARADLRGAQALILPLMASHVVALADMAAVVLAAGAAIGLLGPAWRAVWRR